MPPGARSQCRRMTSSPRPASSRRSATSPRWASPRSARAGSPPRRPSGKAPPCRASSSPARSPRGPRALRSTASRVTRVRAGHLAETKFGLPATFERIDAAALVPYLLEQISHGPELWHQRAYLARVINLDRDTGITNEGVVPLQSFLDSGGGNAVAATLESNGQGNPYPVVYVRKEGSVAERAMAPEPMLDFTGRDYQNELRSVLEPVLSGAASPA